ncbi:MAG: hypothetical protein WC307_03630 [Candidatus Nanoarchaeia archaeon]|jgi:ribosomal protein S3AE
MAQKKKKWYKLLSPKIFGSKELGETISNDPKKLIGRVITVNAKELTSDFKKSHISIKLAISKVEEESAQTEINGYIVSRAYIQRFIRKGISSIEIIQNLLTSDKQRIRVKCMAIANGNLQTTKKKLIRDRFGKEFEKMVNNMTLDNLVFIATTNKIQKMLVTKLKKTHPLRFVEINKISLLDKKKLD